MAGGVERAGAEVAREGALRGGPVVWDMRDRIGRQKKERAVVSQDLRKAVIDERWKHAKETLGYELSNGLASARRGVSM